MHGKGLTGRFDAFKHVRLSYAVESVGKAPPSIPTRIMAHLMTPLLILSPHLVLWDRYARLIFRPTL